MTDKKAQAEAVGELFEELLNGGEVERAHRDTPAGALLFAKVSKRVCGEDKNGREIVFWQSWEHFKDMSVERLHQEFMRMQDMPRAEVLMYLKGLSKGDAA